MLLPWLLCWWYCYEVLQGRTYFIQEYAVGVQRDAKYGIYFISDYSHSLRCFLAFISGSGNKLQWNWSATSFHHLPGSQHFLLAFFTCLQILPLVGATIHKYCWLFFSQFCNLSEIQYLKIITCCWQSCQCWKRTENDWDIWDGWVRGLSYGQMSPCLTTVPTQIHAYSDQNRRKESVLLPSRLPASILFTFPTHYMWNSELWLNSWLNNLFENH